MRGGGLRGGIGRGGRCEVRGNEIRRSFNEEGVFFRGRY